MTYVLLENHSSDENRAIIDVDGSHREYVLQPLQFILVRIHHRYAKIDVPPSVHLERLDVEDA